MNLLIKDGFVLDPALGLRGTEKRDILIKDSQILKLEEKIPARENLKEEDVTIIDAGNKLIIPGLINSHLHSHDHFNRGRFDNLPLELWVLFIRPWIGAKPLTHREIYLRTIIGAMEMVQTGATCGIDEVNLAPFNRLENVDAVMRAYQDVGMRAFVAASVFDKPAYRTVPHIEQLLPQEIRSEMDQSSGFTIDDWMSFLHECLETWHGSEGLTWFFTAASAPQRCTDHLLLKLNDLSERHHSIFMTHTLETKVQRVTGEAFYGKSVIEHLNDLGMLGPKTALAHCVWVSERDLDLISEKESCLLHCPVSNLKLGSGVAPLEKMLEKNIHLALGTDNTSCNDSQNMFEAMKFAALLPKTWHANFSTWPKAEDVFRMATSGGAHVARMGGQIGSLSPGSMADLTILDLEHVSYLPVGEIERNIVYSENGGSVDTVIINGEIVLKDKKMTKVNQEDLFSEIMDTAQRLKKEHRSVYEKAKSIYPYFEEAYFKCHEEFEKLRYQRPK